MSLALPPSDLLTLFNTLPGANLLLAPDLRIVGASDDYLAATLTDRATIVGQLIFDAFPENPEAPNSDAVANVRASLLQVLTSGQPHEMAPQHYDAPDPTQPGQFIERHWQLRHTPVFGADGQVQFIVQSVQDITESHLAERRLRESQAGEQVARAYAEQQRMEIRYFMEQAPVAVAVYQGPQFRVELANAATLAIWGRPLAAVLHRPVFEVMPEAATPEVLAIFERVFSTGIPHTASEQLTYIYRNGRQEEVYWNFVFEPRYGADGRISGIFSVGTEVTEQVRARRQVEQFDQELETRVQERTQAGLAQQAQVLNAAERQVQERETFYQTFEQTPACIALLRSPEHRFEYVNAAYQQLFPRRPLVGRPLREALPEAEAQGFLALMDNVYQTGETFFGTELLLTVEQGDGLPAKDTYFTFTYQAYQEHGAVVGISIFAYDVTEQVLARHEREAQQRNFATLFEQAPIGLGILVGPELVFEFANPSYHRLLPQRLLLGRPLREVMPELMGTDLERMLQHVYETGETQQKDAFLLPTARVDKNGQLSELEDRYFTLVCQARRDEQGRINGVLNFAMDVTEQVQARQRVEESREELKRFKFMADQARDPFILIRENASFAYLNQCALDAWGYSAEELESLRVPDLDPIYHDEAFNQLFAEAQYQAVPLFDTLHQRKDGYVFPVEISAAGLQLDGQPHLLVVARDITEQKRFMAALQESEARFRTMADAAPNMVWAVHPDSSIRYVNRAFLDFVGVENEEQYIATGWKPYLHPDELELTQSTLTQVIGQRQPYVLEHRMRHHDGQYRWLLAQGAPSYLADGELYGYVGSAIDITELKQANEQLRRTNADLDNFIYTASHDLKAPISNIEGLLYLLQLELADMGKQNVYVEGTLTRMLDSVERFKRTIDHLTDVSKLQKEHAPVTTSVVLAQVVEAVSLDLAPLLAESKARLRLDVEGVPAVLMSEKNLRSVVFNLLSNALKYRSPSREADIRVRAYEAGTDTVLAVQDNGLGIAEEHLPQLFTMFQRFHDHVEGSGIGLFMVKRMVENAGGRIEVETEFDQGSTFRVFLPQ